MNMKTSSLIIFSILYCQSIFSQSEFTLDHLPFLSEKTELQANSSLTINGNNLSIYQYFHQAENHKPLHLNNDKCGGSKIEIEDHVLTVSICEYFLTIDSNFLELDIIDLEKKALYEERNPIKTKPVPNILFSSNQEFSLNNSPSILHRFFCDVGDLSIKPNKKECKAGEGGSTITVTNKRSKISLSSLYNITIIEMDSDSNGEKELFIIEDRGCSDVLSVYQITFKHML